MQSRLVNLVHQLGLLLQITSDRHVRVHVGEAVDEPPVGAEAGDLHVDALAHRVQPPRSVGVLPEASRAEGFMLHTRGFLSCHFPSCQIFS